jgi:LAO/AO transport system kinase
LAAGEELARRLRNGDLDIAPTVLNLVESSSEADREQTAGLLAAVSPGALNGEAPGHIVGITGPPGAGKSTLLSELTREWRETGRTVAVLAVDPSSKRSGGALLGDRARIVAKPGDDGVFIRSTAAGSRLGGLAPATRAAAQALAVAFDIVVIETVGVGQSETEVSDVADSVAVIIQPGSGDVLQFLKAGIMETPDLLVVTKSDLGATAHSSVRDANAALAASGSGNVPVLAVSAIPPVTGIAELVAALDDHRAALDITARRTETRRASAVADFVAEHGEKRLRALGGRRSALKLLDDRPTTDATPELVAALEAAS